MMSGISELHIGLSAVFSIIELVSLSRADVSRFCCTLNISRERSQLESLRCDVPLPKTGPHARMEGLRIVDGCGRGNYSQ
jgi:hypothetical protein